MALYQHIPAASVPAEFKELAKDWPVWDSKEADPPLVDGKVHFTYDGDYGSERVLIVSGKATITPDDGTDPVEVGEGDAVYLHKGFECTWTVHEPLVQHYGYFGVDGKEIKQTELTCDICGEDCFEESYLFNDEVDICPRCFISDSKGAEEYEGAEYQREGVKATKPAKKQRTSTGGKKSTDFDPEAETKEAKPKAESKSPKSPKSKKKSKKEQKKEEEEEKRRAVPPPQPPVTPPQPPVLTLEPLGPAYPDGARLSWTPAGVPSGTVVRRYSIQGQEPNDSWKELHPNVFSEFTFYARWLRSGSHQFKVVAVATRPDGSEVSSESNTVIRVVTAVRPNPNLVDSKFRELYTIAQAQTMQPGWANPVGLDLQTIVTSLGSAVQMLVHAYGRGQQPPVPPAVIDNFLNRDQFQLPAHLTNAGQAVQANGLLDIFNLGSPLHQYFPTVLRKVVALWTSNWPLHLSPGRQVELCSMLNEVLRQDQPGDGLNAATLLTAALTKLTDLRNRGNIQWDQMSWRTRNCSFRGTFIPRHVLQSFFTKNKEYRAPMWLATSMNENKALDFIRGSRPGREPTIFTVIFEPIPNFPPGHTRCNHVNYIPSAESLVPGEDELLFAPYSSFKVRHVDLRPNPTPIAPNRITIVAFPENKEEVGGPSESLLELSTWH